MKRKPLYAVYLCGYMVLSFGLTQFYPYLTYVGYTAAQRGIMASVYGVANIVFQMLLGYLCDKFRRVKEFFYLSISVYALAVFALYCFDQVLFPLHLSIMIFSGGLVFANFNMMDNWYFSLGEEVRPYYSLGRMFSSLGWLAGSLTVALIIGAVGYRGLAVVMLAMTAVTIAITRYASRGGGAALAGRQPMRLADVRLLFRQRQYLLVVVSLFFIYCATGTYGTVVVDKMTALGASNMQIGLRWAVCSIVEMPMFFIGVRLLARFRPQRLLMVAAFAVIAQFVGFTISTTVAGMLAASFLQLLTVPLIHLGSRTLLYDLSPDRLKSSGLLVAAALYQGISSMLVPSIGGMITDRFGVNTTLRSITCLSCFGVLVILYLNLSRRWRDKEGQAEPPVSKEA